MDVEQADVQRVAEHQSKESGELFGSSDEAQSWRDCDLRSPLEVLREESESFVCGADLEYACHETGVGMKNIFMH